MRGRIGLVVLLIGLVFLGAGGVAQETGVKVSITAPVDRFVTAETKVQVEGMASTTAPGDSIFVVLVVVNGVAQKAELGNDGKFKSTVNLVPGENIISAIAVTKNREVASAKVSVTMNSQPRVVFFDDFDRTPRPEWKPITGSWVSIDGQYTVGRDIHSGGFISLVDLKRALQAYSIDVGINFGGYTSYTAVAWIFVRAQDEQNAIVLSLVGSNSIIKEARWYVRKNGAWGQPLAQSSLTMGGAEVAHVRVEVQNTGHTAIYRAYVGGKEIIAQISESSFMNATSVGLGQYYEFWSEEGKRTTFDNFKVESTDAKASVEPPREQPQQPTLPPQPPVAADLEPRVVNLESQVSNLQGAVAAVSARVDKIESQLPVSPGVPVEFGQRLSTLEGLVGNVDVGGLSRELATVKITVASLSADQTRFKQDLDHLKQALPSSNVEGRLAQIQQSLDSLSQKVEDSNQKLAAAESSARLALIAGAAGVALALLVVSGVIR